MSIRRSIVPSCLPSAHLLIRLKNLTAEAADARYAVAVVNGTAALQIALQIVGVKPGDEVITQALSFVATSNAIHYNQAAPVFLDVSESTMGLCPQALRTFFRRPLH